MGAAASLRAAHTFLTADTITPELYARPDTCVPFFKYGIQLYTTSATHVTDMCFEDTRNAGTYGVPFDRIVAGADAGGWSLRPLHTYTPTDMADCADSTASFWRPTSQDVGTPHADDVQRVDNLNWGAPTDDGSTAHFCTSIDGLRKHADDLQALRDSDSVVGMTAAMWQLTPGDGLVRVAIHVAK